MQLTGGGKIQWQVIQVDQADAQSGKQKYEQENENSGFGRFKKEGGGGGCRV
jgi:hypothetical protein